MLEESVKALARLCAKVPAYGGFSFACKNVCARAVNNIAKMYGTSHDLEMWLQLVYSAPERGRLARPQDVAAADYVAKTSRSSVGELDETLTKAAAARCLRITNKKI